METTIYIGIDPGKKGAIGVLWGDGRASVYDLTENQSGSYFDTVTTLREILGNNEPASCMVTIEDVHAMPKQGVSSTFNFGEGKGVIIGAVIALGMRLQFVSPSAWKRAMHLSANKSASRDAARATFPTLSDDLKRVKDDGRAEAILIAEWARQHAK